MKQLITTTFTAFVNEHYSNDRSSSCCNAPLDDEHMCTECGAYETNENFEDDDFANTLSDQSGDMPADVSNITKLIIDGNFERSKILGMDGNSVKVRMTDQDFKYAPDSLALRDFGFETWSSKPYDVKLKLEDADPSERVVTYSVEYAEKGAKRLKAEPEEDNFEADDEYYKDDEFETLPETPDDDSDDIVSKNDRLFRSDDISLDDDDDEELMEGRKKKVQGGFAKLKVKNAPKYSNPNNKARRDAKKTGGLNQVPKAKIMKKDLAKTIDKKPLDTD